MDVMVVVFHHGNPNIIWLKKNWIDDHPHGGNKPCNLCTAGTCSGANTRQVIGFSSTWMGRHQQGFDDEDFQRGTSRQLFWNGIFFGLICLEFHGFFVVYGGLFSNKHRFG